MKILLKAEWQKAGKGTMYTRFVLSCSGRFVLCYAWRDDKVWRLLNSSYMPLLSTDGKLSAPEFRSFRELRRWVAVNLAA